MTWRISNDQTVSIDLLIFLLFSWIRKRIIRETETRENMVGDKQKHNFTPSWTLTRTATSIYILSLSKGAATDQKTVQLLWRNTRKNPWYNSGLNKNDQKKKERPMTVLN
jgi:hypothetical protein